jgi:hypothetical protein
MAAVDLASHEGIFSSKEEDDWRPPEDGRCPDDDIFIDSGSEAGSKESQGIQDYSPLHLAQ